MFLLVLQFCLYRVHTSDFFFCPTCFLFEMLLYVIFCNLSTIDTWRRTSFVFSSLLLILRGSTFSSCGFAFDCQECQLLDNRVRFDMGGTAFTPAIDLPRRQKCVAMHALDIVREFSKAHVLRFALFLTIF